MGVRHKELFHIVRIYCLHALYAFSSSVLGFECILRHALDIAKLCHGDDHIFLWDQILHRDIKLIVADLRPSVISVLVLDDKDFLLYDAQEDLSVGQDRLQLADALHQLIVFVLQLLSLQTCQSPQTHVHDSLGLCVREVEALHQLRLCLLHVGRAADDLYHLVDMVQGDEQSLEDVGSLLRSVQLIPGPSRHDLLLVLQIAIQHIQKVHDFRLVVDKSKHDDAEGILELGVLVELI